MLNSMKNSVCGLALLLQILHKEGERWIVSKKEIKPMKNINRKSYN